MVSEIELIKNENLLNYLPLELEDMICEFLKEHPLKKALRKELKEVLKPYNTDDVWKKYWDKERFYWNYRTCVRMMKRIKYDAGCGKHKFIWMKNYNKRCECGYF